MPQLAPLIVLMADDDEDDRLLARDALRESGVPFELHCVGDGEELLAYLRREGRYAAAGAAPPPDVVLLDLNMPRLGGAEALARIKADPALRSTPVLVMTTSKAEEDVAASYDLGAAGFISKPIRFDELVTVMRRIGAYWAQTVELPRRV